MSIYVEFVDILENKISNTKAESVKDVWEVFKDFFSTFHINKPKSVTNFGIMAELSLGSAHSSPLFYFSLHYLVDDGEFNYSEWVYCEFNLTQVDESILTASSIELWDWDHEISDMFNQIENWLTFKVMQERVLPLTVHGTES